MKHYLRKRIKYFYPISALLLILVSCSINQSVGKQKFDELTTWNNTAVKSEIVQFVENVSNPGNPNFVPQSKRIAVFDLDGTLLCERPMYVSALMAIEHLKKQISQDSNLVNIQPYKAIAENNLKYLWHHPDELIGPDHFGKTQQEYIASVDLFFEKQINPDNDIPYRNLFYVPMINLIKYLHAYGFQVYIVSGSTQGFIRAFCEKYLYIPQNFIIGSEIKLSFQYSDSAVKFIRDNKFESINADTIKALNIKNRIGIKPIFAFGNSNGDLQMLQLSFSNNLPNIQLVLDHDDSKREYEYSKEKLLNICKKNGWKIVSMKNDFRIIFAGEKR